jgi:hypothetical protein
MDEVISAIEDDTPQSHALTRIVAPSEVIVQIFC